jgi:hypothetical protein
VGDVAGLPDVLAADQVRVSGPDVLQPGGALVAQTLPISLCGVCSTRLVPASSHSGCG